jgi:hypothetical protein
MERSRFTEEQIIGILRAQEARVSDRRIAGRQYINTCVDWLLEEPVGLISPRYHPQQLPHSCSHKASGSIGYPL